MTPGPSAQRSLLPPSPSRPPPHLRPRNPQTPHPTNPNKRPLKIAMGTFIVSFIGNSFIEYARGTQPMQLLEPDPDKQRRILCVVFFTIIIAFIT